MNIILCGSMSSAQTMITIKADLEACGHEVVLPKMTEEIASGKHQALEGSESAQEKIEHDLIRDYYEVIKTGDAVLAVNVEKKGIKGYIGGNTFLEMGFAHVLGKKLYVYNDIPDLPYTDEIVAMQPVVLHGDVAGID